ncbi:MAG: orotidine-5'-phosphate decarboxylase [Bacteroidales bacterium]|nr:orotidine-5'-phosphate decarboxylase [Bacteroidales bacterium]
MNYIDLSIEIVKKESFLCIGLDSEIEKIPEFLLEKEDPVFEFNKRIIDATNDLAVAYKINTAFYESRGLKGWESLKKTEDYLKNFPEILSIADAKRGDIGNTSEQYAKAFFKNLKFDAITIAPYMGVDSVSPFLSFKDKWVILLALTSNVGASDFQFNYITESQEYLYEQIIRKSSEWGDKQNMMYVVGATQAEHLVRIRKIIPNHFLLVPGVGAQGGSLENVAKFGMNKSCGLLVNSSRGIIFAGTDGNFANKAREQAIEIQQEMKILLKKYL